MKLLEVRTKRKISSRSPDYDFILMKLRPPEYCKEKTVFFSYFQQVTNFRFNCPPLHCISHYKNESSSFKLSSFVRLSSRRITCRDLNWGYRLTQVEQETHNLSEDVTYHSFLSTVATHFFATTANNVSFPFCNQVVQVHKGRTAFSRRLSPWFFGLTITHAGPDGSYNKFYRNLQECRCR